MANRFVYKAPAVIRHPKKRAVLTAYGVSMGGIVSACQKANIHHSTFYEWKASDPVFAAALKEADDLLGEWLQRTILERAILGKRPSDTLLIFEAKGRWPEKYRERHEITMTRQEREARIEELLTRRGTSLPVPTSEATNGHAAE